MAPSLLIWFGLVVYHKEKLEPNSTVIENTGIDIFYSIIVVVACTMLNPLKDYNSDFKRKKKSKGF